MHRPALTPPRTALATLLAVALLGAPAGRVEAQEPIAVIVHPANSLGGLTLDELRRIYLGRLTAMPGGDRIELGEVAALRARFYTRVLGMNPDRFKRHWISMVFAGDGAVPPQDLGAPQDAVRYVGSHPAAIAFVPSGSVGSTVRVLPINGARPGEPAYPIP